MSAGILWHGGAAPPSAPTVYVPQPGDESASDCGLKAEIFSRIQYIRTVGFQNFTANKAFVVSDAVPKGKVRWVLALSAYRVNATARMLHFFAIPPQDADALVNPTADVVASIFRGATNNPPLTSGVLVSIGGNTSVGEMVSQTALSVNGLLNPFPLPERWKILCFIDSGEIPLAGDGIVLDMACIDFDACECVPDSLL